MGYHPSWRRPPRGGGLTLVEYYQLVTGFSLIMLGCLLFIVGASGDPPDFLWLHWGACR